MWWRAKRHPIAMDETEHERREAQYQSRNEKLRHAIDVLASYDKAVLERHGKKAEVAREHDIERHRIDYVLTHWEELVEYRRQAARSPLDPDAVKAAYDDETMQAMAEAGRQPVADGAGEITVDFTFTLDEAFRAMKLLPGDLGYKAYGQILSADLPHSDIERILNQE